MWTSSKALCPVQIIVSSNVLLFIQIRIRDESVEEMDSVRWMWPRSEFAGEYWSRAVSQVQLQESRVCFTGEEIEHVRFKKTPHGPCCMIAVVSEGTTLCCSQSSFSRQKHQLLLRPNNTSLLRCFAPSTSPLLLPLCQNLMLFAS